MTRKDFPVSAEEQALMESLLKRKASSPRPRAGFRDELYGRLMRNYVQREYTEESTDHGIFSWHGVFRFWLVTACILLCFAGTGLTTTYAYFSSSVTRTSNLYFLKKTVESLELLTSFTPEQRSRLHMKLAHRRLQEAEVLTEQGMVDQETLQEIVSNTEQAQSIASEVTDAQSQITLSTYIASETQRQRADLVSLVRQLESDSTTNASETSSQSLSSSESSSFASAVSVTSQSSLSSSASIAPLQDLPNNLPSSAMASVNDASTVGALEKAIADIGKVEVNAMSTAMKAGEESGLSPLRPRILPDLLSSLTPGRSVREGEIFDLTVQIHNIGQRSSPVTTMSVIWGDGVVDAYSIPPLNRSEMTTMNLSHRFHSVGTFIIRVQIDPSGHIEELTTANNRSVVSIDITAIPHDTCPGLGVKRCLGQQLQVCQRPQDAEALSWQILETCQNVSLCTQDGCLSQPVCGNRIIDMGEECDDGNIWNGDGCSYYCKKEVNHCLDSDGGKVPSLKGTTQLLSGLSKIDYCLDSSTIMEFLCRNGEVVNEPIICPFGCKDGACQGTASTSSAPSSGVCGDGKVGIGEECDLGASNGNSWCSSSCKTQCVDDDGGKVFDRKGMTQSPRMSATDYCKDSQTLVEYVCESGVTTSVENSCPNGCSNGVCLSVTAPACGNGKVEGSEQCDDGNTMSGDGCSASCQSECTDSDGGDRPLQRGTARKGTESYQDQCELGKLKEYYCESGSIHSRIVDCFCASEPQTEGVCIESSTCTDSEKPAGAAVWYQDPFIKGTTTVNFRNSAGFSATISHTDECSSAGLIDFTCSPISDRITAAGFGQAMTCVNGCKDGACIALPTSMCGDAKVEGSEQCDDGNTVSGDGCSSDCRLDILSCTTIKAQSIASATNGTVTAYVKDYGLFVCTSGNDVPVEVELKNAGVNYPAMAGSNLLYFKSYGIVLYNLVSKVKLELEPVSSGVNYPVIAGKYVAYFKSYGIVLYNIETKQKIVVEQPNSGCTFPKISGTTLTYSCEGFPKTYAIEGPTCGDGIVQSPEQCDDGNTTNGDGCSALCAKEVSATFPLYFTMVDALTGQPIAGVHDIYANQPQSDTSGKLTLMANRDGSSWILEKGCYGFYQVKVQKDYLGKALALILKPFDAPERVYDISGMNSVDVRSIAGDAPMYPFAQFRLESSQPVIFTLVYDYKQLPGSTAMTLSTANTQYIYSPGIPRGYEAHNIQVQTQNGASIVCPAYTPSSTYDPGVCRQVVLSISGDTCSWHE